MNTETTTVSEPNCGNHGMWEGMEKNCPDCKKLRDAAERARAQVAWDKSIEEKRYRESVHRDAIAAQITAQGHACRATSGKGQQFIVDGTDVEWDITIEEKRERGRSYWRSTAPLPLVVVIGRWSKSKRRFPQKKDGTFNYAAIASELIIIAQRHKSSEAKDKVHRHNKELVTAFEAEHPMKDTPLYLDASDDEKKPFMLQIKFYRNLTEAEVLKIYELMKEFKAT